MTAEDCSLCSTYQQQTEQSTIYIPALPLLLTKPLTHDTHKQASLRRLDITARTLFYPGATPSLIKNVKTCKDLGPSYSSHTSRPFWRSFSTQPTARERSSEYSAGALPKTPCQIQVCIHLLVFALSLLTVASRILRLAVQVAVTSYLFYLVNEYLLGYEEEEDEPRAETAAPSIAVASKPIQQGVEGTKAPEAEQVEELLVQLPDKLPEGAVFIPLWWGTRRPTTYYKNTDPEWQGYLKFVHDENKPRELRGRFCWSPTGTLGD